MNGAESLIRTAIDCGVEVCFANPGTTEMPVVAAMDRIPGIRAVLGLHESVVTGAADGYGRMAGKPALTLLHLGPGFANGIANLHNARRARTPLINLIGEHASWHLAADAPLHSDIDSLARTVSSWVRSSASAAQMSHDFAEAFAAVTNGAGQSASLILPHDYQLGETNGAAPPPAAVAPAAVPDDRIKAAAEALGRGHAAVMLGDTALTVAGLQAAARVGQRCDVPLFCQRGLARAERGAGLPSPHTIPYLPEQALEALAGFRSVVYAGARDPVAFFGWPGYPSRMLPEGCAEVQLARPGEDIVGALEALADHMNAPAYTAPAAEARPELASGPLTADAVCRTIARFQPENCILVDEAITSGWSYHTLSSSAPRFSQLSITGGAIGIGPACATGAAIACPDRTVINFEADGSGMYTVQALWTQAREALDVVTVICANRAYKILQMELQRGGLNAPGPQAQALTSLADPTVDWTKVAEGLGVGAVSVDTAEALADAFQQALATRGPALIEAVISA